MNFKFPSALENPRPNPNYNANPNSSYFTQQAIRAGYVTNDVRRPEIDGYSATGDVRRREYDSYTSTGDVSRREYESYPTTGDVTRREFNYSQNAGNVSSSMLREIEKDRIRAEIIAEEMMKRRILEEEVRRDMMRERELGYRLGKPEFGVGESVGRVPMVAGFGHRDVVGGARVPSYREVEYGGGFHAMPYSREQVVGGGRGSGVTLREIKEVSRDKAIVLAKPRSNLVDLKRKTTMPPIGGAMDAYKKQKTKDGWSCSLCQITTTSERGLKDHLRGKKHLARESGMASPVTGFGTVPLPKALSTSTVKPSTSHKILSKQSLNYDGKTGGGLSLTHVDKSIPPKPNHIPLKQKSTLTAKKGFGKGKAPATSKSVVGKKKFQYFCEICQIGSDSLIVFDAHKKGKKHSANLSLLNKTDETTEVVASAQKVVINKKKGEAKKPVIGKVDKPPKKFRHFCEMCKVGANSMTVFEAHMKGKKHVANLSLLNKTDEPAQTEASAQKAVTEDNKELTFVETITTEEPEETDGEELAAVETFVTEEPEEPIEEQVVAEETLMTGEPEETCGEQLYAAKPVENSEEHIDADGSVDEDEEELLETKIVGIPAP